MTARNMRKNVQINVGVSTPKNNKDKLKLPDLDHGDRLEADIAYNQGPPRTSTGHKVPKIGVDVLGLTPTALKKTGSRDGRRASIVKLGNETTQYDNLYKPRDPRKSESFEQ